MLTHIVLFKLKDRSVESINKARDILLGMEGKIPQLRHLEVGVDVLGSERSYDLALYTKFDTMEDMLTYQVHPLHKEVGDYMISVREHSVCIDYI